MVDQTLGRYFQADRREGEKAQRQSMHARTDILTQLEKKDWGTYVLVGIMNKCKR